MAYLQSLSNTNGSTRGNAAIGVLLSYSPTLNLIDSKSGFEDSAVDFAWRPILDSNGSFSARAEGANFSGNSTFTPNANQTGALAIYQGGFDIDEVRLMDAQSGRSDMKTWFDNRWKRELIGTAKAIDTALWNADGTSNTLTGFKTLSASNLPGLSVSRLVNAASYSLQTSAKSFDIGLALTDDKVKQREAFLEMLTYESADMEGDYVYIMSPKLYGRMTTIAQKETILGETRDNFGKPVQTFNGIPMIKMLDTAILNTEPDDTGTPLNVTTSIYMISFAEMQASVLTNSGLAYKEFDWLESKQSGREQWLMTLQPKIENAKAFKRIRNIKV